MSKPFDCCNDEMVITDPETERRRELIRNYDFLEDENMDSYRNKPLNLDTVDDKLDIILDELKRVEPKKSSPIFYAIGSKITDFDLINFAFTIFVIVCISAAMFGIGYSVYKYSLSSNEITSCKFDVNTSDPKKTTIYAYSEWHPISNWGPFNSLDEAITYAKLNGCPNMEE